MQAVAERILGIQQRQHERQVEELEALMHLQSSSQLRELNALFERQALELSRLGGELMERIAVHAATSGDVDQFVELQALDDQWGEAECQGDQPAEQAKRIDDVPVEQGAMVIRNPYVDYDIPSACSFQDEVASSGRDTAADVRELSCDVDKESGGRQQTCGDRTATVPRQATGDARGNSGCNRISAGRAGPGVRDGHSGPRAAERSCGGGTGGTA